MRIVSRLGPGTPVSDTGKDFLHKTSRPDLLPGPNLRTRGSFYLLLVSLLIVFLESKYFVLLFLVLLEFTVRHTLLCNYLMYISH